MVTIKKLASFIESSVKSLLLSDDGTTFRFILDENFAVYVGWGEGFDENDEGCYHSKSQPTYCICTKIAENIPNFSWEDAYMPWYTDGSDEVYDTDSSVSVNENYEQLAKWLIESYKEMKKMLENDEITF